MIEFVLPVIFGITVGLALGLTGGGGSIFAVPLLIYGLGLPPVQAVPVSLVTVAMTALIGAFHTFKDRLLVWQPAVVFAAGGMIGAPVGVLITRRIDEHLIVSGFALLSIIVGSFMWRSAKVSPAEAAVVRARLHSEEGGGVVCRLSESGELHFSAPCAAVITVVGLGTGILSGLFGVGGGFLIVPALVGITRMGIHRAIAASLVIISVIGFTGAASALWQGDILWGVLLPFVAGGAMGMLSGRSIAARIAGVALQRFFGGAIISVGLGMLLHTGFLNS
jgi:uncharacterized protein